MQMNPSLFLKRKRTADGTPSEWQKNDSIPLNSSPASSKSASVNVNPLTPLRNALVSSL